MVNLLPSMLALVGKPATFVLIFALWGVEMLIRGFKTLNRLIARWIWRRYAKIIGTTRNSFEHRWARFVVGLAILPLAMLIGLASPSLVQGQETVIDPSSLQLSENANMILKTVESIRTPLSVTTINQGFSSGHQGIDLKGQINEPIHPIMRGKVLEASHTRGGYGNYVVVEHGQGLQSLYGHMNWIVVEPGYSVNTESVLGGVGSTGNSTGPHLHLEVIDGGKKVNPLTVIGGR